VVEEEREQTACSFTSFMNRDVASVERIFFQHQIEKDAHRKYDIRTGHHYHFSPSTAGTSYYIPQISPFFHSLV
jgi:hypothetical protein